MSAAGESPLSELRFYPAREVVGALHIGYDTLNRALASGALVGVHMPGKKVRFTEEAVRAWLRSCETESTDWRVK